MPQLQRGREGRSQAAGTRHTMTTGNRLPPLALTQPIRPSHSPLLACQGHQEQPCPWTSLLPTIAKPISSSTRTSRMSTRRPVLKGTSPSLPSESPKPNEPATAARRGQMGNARWHQGRRGRPPGARASEAGGNGQVAARRGSSEAHQCRWLSACQAVVPTRPIQERPAGMAHCGKVVSAR